MIFHRRAKKAAGAPRIWSAPNAGSHYVKRKTDDAAEPQLITLLARESS
jgi:hypothetical protein